jgi:hypothetical protein
MVRELDAAARQEIVIYRDHNQCQRCSLYEGDWIAELERRVTIQWAHVHTREYYVTRWEPDNSLALCDRCHMWFDNHKVISYEWFRKLWPVRWERIQNVLQSGAKADIKQLHAEL